jgi:hypothetical protein
MTSTPQTYDDMVRLLRLHREGRQELHQVLAPEAERGLVSWRLMQGGRIEHGEDARGRPSLPSGQST